MSIDVIKDSRLINLRDSIPGNILWSHATWPGSEQAVAFFPNGWGVSFVVSRIRGAGGSYSSPGTVEACLMVKDEVGYTRAMRRDEPNPVHPNNSNHPIYPDYDMEACQELARLVSRLSPRS